MSLIAHRNEPLRCGVRAKQLRLQTHSRVSEYEPKLRIARLTRNRALELLHERRNVVELAFAEGVVLFVCASKQVIDRHRPRKRQQKTAEGYPKHSGAVHSRLLDVRRTGAKLDPAKSCADHFRASAAVLGSSAADSPVNAEG